MPAAQTGFVLLVSGFVVYEVLSEWKPSKAVLKWAPTQVVDALGIEGPAAGFVSAAIMFVLFPAILFLLVASLTKLLKGSSFGAAMKSFALLLIPTMAGAHVIKATSKMTSRIPYWSHALKDTVGVRTAYAIVDGPLVLDKTVPAALQPATTGLAAVLLIAALAATLLVFRKSPTIAEVEKRARVPMLLAALAYWAVFAVTIFLWRF